MNYNNSIYKKTDPSFQGVLGRWVRKARMQLPISD